MKTVSFLASVLLMAQMPAFGNEINRHELIKQVEQVAQVQTIPELPKESPPSVPTNVQPVVNSEPIVAAQIAEPANDLAELAKLERPATAARTELDPVKLKQALEALKALQHKKTPPIKSP